MWVRGVFFLGFLFFSFGKAFCVLAQDAAYPSYGSLKNAITNVRAGPGTQYPILWVFQRQGWPVEILTKYQTWYKIRDPEGEEGWVYGPLLSFRQTSIITDGPAADLYRHPSENTVVLKLSPDVIVGVDTCTPHMCEVSYDGYNGWVVKNRLAFFNIEEEQ